MQDPDTVIAGEHFDIAIAGFGPCGTVMTCLLAQQGLRVLAVDRSRTVYEKPRAIALDHEIMRVFQEIGIADAISPFIAPFPASHHYGADSQLIRTIDAVPPPFPLGFTPTLVFSQPAVEAMLREQAAKLAAVRIALGTELIGFSQSETEASLTLRTPQGDDVTVTASYLVGCDGATSTVRRLAKLALDDLEFDEPWLVVDVMLNEAGAARLPKLAAQHCNPDRPTSYIVGPGLHRRWEIMLSPGEDPREAEQHDNVWRLLAPWVSPSEGELWRAASYRFHALVAREWRDRRVFIAGDAAHQQPPFIGQGMCQGVRDVVNLSWKIAEVIHKNAPDALLDTYGIERGAHVRALTARIKQIGRVICERDPAAARERDAKILAEGGGKPRVITRQEIVPPLNEGLLSSRPSKANGVLFPQPRIYHDDGIGLLDDVAGRGWRLILNGAWLTAREAEMLTAGSPSVNVFAIITGDKPAVSNQQLKVYLEVEGVATNWLAAHGCAAALVRPDHYVYGAAADASQLSQLIEEVRQTLK